MESSTSSSEDSSIFDLPEFDLTTYIVDGKYHIFGGEFNNSGEPISSEELGGQVDDIVLCTYIFCLVELV